MSGVSRIIVITGTDTGVGKTVFTALLARCLMEKGAGVAALKPICSGGRGDARILKRAIGSALTLDQINPWHFRAALAPVLGARREGKPVTLREVVSHVHRFVVQFPIVLVEGAGGLLSPLGEGFSTRELIGALGADVIVVARNQLGVVNHVRLTVEALPPIVAARAQVVLMSPRRADAASRTNARLLGEFVPAAHVHNFPFFEKSAHYTTSALGPSVRRTLDALLQA